MIFLTELMVIILTFAFGILAGRYFAPGNRRIKELEVQLKEEKQQQQAYKDHVSEHFSESANLFGDITEKYRSLYEHMSAGAYKLCDRRSIPRALSTSHVNILAVESPEIAPELNDNTQPLSTSEQSTDDLIVDVSRQGLSPLDTDSQRIAQQGKINKEDKETVNTAEIIDLNSQRSEGKSHLAPQEQAKDYAIKAKGVINHNSLNRDDVAT